MIRISNVYLNDKRNYTCWKFNYKPHNTNLKVILQILILETVVFETLSTKNHGRWNL